MTNKTITLEITKSLPQKEQVTITLPYYYTYSSDYGYGNSEVFGKLEEDQVTSITIITGRKHGIIFSKEVAGIKQSACFIRDDYNCTEDVFEAAKKKFLDFINN